MVRHPAPPGAARRGAARGGAMKPSIVRGPPAFDRFLTGLTRSKAAVGAMGPPLAKIPLHGGAVQLRRVCAGRFGPAPRDAAMTVAVTSGVARRGGGPDPC